MILELKSQLLSILWELYLAVGIDNALIEIDNEEVPILDGSAKEFIEKF